VDAKEKRPLQEEFRAVTKASQKKVAELTVGQGFRAWRGGGHSGG
jgi:hypothetical protein